MNDAMKQLMENQQAIHNHVVALDKHMGIVATATAAHFDKVAEDIGNNRKAIEDIYQKIGVELEKQEQYINRLADTTQEIAAAFLLYAAANTEVVAYYQKVRETLQRYENNLQSFIKGLDTLSTGRLTYELLSPHRLQEYLIQIEELMTVENTQYELVFSNVFQYYSHPLCVYSNTDDYILVQVPVYLRPKYQPPLDIYQIETIPVPYDAETLVGHKKQFTIINYDKRYIALQDKHYIPITEKQLERCVKLQYDYLCMSSFLRTNTDRDTCESAVFFRKSSKIITELCNIQFTQDHEYEPRILDLGTQLVLSNLPEPWVLVCHNVHRPFRIQYSTYTIIDRKELCECSLSAGYEYFIQKTMLTCNEDDEITSVHSTEFVMKYANNKAVFDILLTDFKITIDQDVVKILDQLTTDIVYTNLPEVKYYVVQNDWFNEVLPELESTELSVPLRKLLRKVATDSDGRIFKSIKDFQQSQRKFKNYMASATWWQIFEFVMGIISILFFVMFIVTGCCFKKAVVATILGSKTLDDYDMVKVMPSAKADFVIPTMQPLYTIGFHKVNDTFADDSGSPAKLSPLLIVVIVLLIILILIKIAQCIWKRTRHASTLWRSLFPVPQWTGYHRGTCRADVFVEITDLDLNAVIWVHVAKVKWHPATLIANAPLSPNDIDLHTRFCCFTQMYVPWKYIPLKIFDPEGGEIKLPHTVLASVFTGRKLTKMVTGHRYVVKILGRVLDHVMPIMVLPGYDPQNDIAFTIRRSEPISMHEYEGLNPPQGYAAVTNNEYEAVQA